MIEISKKEGIFLNQIVPNYVQTTCKRRHFYMTECAEAYWYLNRYREGKEFKKYNKRNRVKE